MLQLLRPYISDQTIIEPIYASSAFGSRNRCKMVVGGDVEAPLIGIINEDLSVTDISQCPLHIAPIAEILNLLKEVITEYKLTPYNVVEKKGELKYILLHLTGDSSEAILRFVLRSSEAIARIKKSVPLIQRSFSEIKVISVNIQPNHSAIVEGKEEILISEEDKIWDKYNRLQICFTAQSFSQVTHNVADALYSKASKLIGDRSPNGVLDLYCGVGGFALQASAHSSWSLGIEISNSAIAAAKISAARNKISNATFISSDTATFLENALEGSPEMVIVNPPRRGLEREISQKIVELLPKWVLYSSCNPETLSKDLQIFSERYSLEFVQGFDMFPLTKHIETLALMSLK